MKHIHYFHILSNLNWVGFEVSIIIDLSERNNRTIEHKIKDNFKTLRMNFRNNLNQT